MSVELYIADAARVGIGLVHLDYPDAPLAFFVRKLSNGDEVHVLRTVFNWRVLEADKHGHPMVRYWCYPGVGMPTFRAAVRNAASYGDGEPDGWIKSWDGRRGNLVHA